MKSDAPKLPKQAEAKKDGVINPQNYNFNQFQHGKICCSQKSHKSTEVDRRTWLHVATSSDIHQVVEIWKETSTKIYTPF